MKKLPYNTLGEIEGGIRLGILQGHTLGHIKIDDISGDHQCSRCSGLCIDTEMQAVALIDGSSLKGTFCEFKAHGQKTDSLPVKMLPGVTDERFPEFNCPVVERAQMEFPRRSDFFGFTGCPSD